MHMFEALMTRDEDINPIPELAEAVDVSDDGLIYTFKLRDGIKFHNGKEMTSADVAASFERYKKVGIERVILSNVASWETPDPATFVINMTRRSRPSSRTCRSFSVPIVIVPAENASADPLKLEPVGTGPFEFVEFIADSHVKLKRYDGYVPNEQYKDRNGFGGYKVACLDTVTFRIVTEPGARVAGLETGELHAVEDVPRRASSGCEQDPNIDIVPLRELLDPHRDAELRQAADRQPAGPPGDPGRARHGRDHGGGDRRRLQPQLRLPVPRTGTVYSDAGKELYNLKDPAKAKQLLEEAGYKGEELVLLTNKTTPRCTTPRW